MAEARVGISGWTYAPWRGVFYPTGLRQADELAYAAERLTSIELNGSFYSLQKPTSWRRWREETPDDFVFSIKAPRFLTPIRRPDDIEEPLANFFASGLLGLGPKLGPILWQLPPSLEYDPELVGRFLALLPHDTEAALAVARRRGERMRGKELLEIDEARPLRHAIEPRAHSSYARLHGDEELYTSGYDDPALDAWEEWTRDHLDHDRDVYVYFDNDQKVRAPVDAMALLERLAG